MVGILTFHRAVNYGAVLQAYALQNTLDELHIDNKIIDYRCEFIEKHYAAYPNVSPIHVKHYIQELLTVSTKKKRKNAFERFASEYLHTSGIVDKEHLPQIASEYSAVITGSDQVWNMAVSGEDTAYALDWITGSVRKISYAASIGPKLVKKEYCAKLEPWLKKYDVLSVREPSAIDVVEKLSGKTVCMDVDPTVLPDISLWKRLADASKYMYKKYVFVYVMQPSDALFDVAEYIAQKENLRILTISMVANRRKLGETIQAAGVEDFLWLIRNAEYVITNSFHGLMFSLRFHKRFFWNYQDGAQMSNPRFDMLVDQYGIDCRCCHNKEESSLCKEMSFDTVEQVMSIQRKKSKKHIKESV